MGGSAGGVAFAGFALDGGVSGFAGCSLGLDGTEAGCLGDVVGCLGDVVGCLCGSCLVGVVSVGCWAGVGSVGLGVGVEAGFPGLAVGKWDFNHNKTYGLSDASNIKENERTSKNHSYQEQ